MLVKIPSAFALTLILTFTPAAASYVLEIPGPSLVVLESTSGVVPDLRDDPARAFRPVVLEASPSHLVLAAGGPGLFLVDVPEGDEVVATITRAYIVEREIQLAGGAHAVARSFHAVAFGTKEEDHDLDPDPKNADERALVTLITAAEISGLKEEDHDLDPDPKSAVFGLKEEDHDLDPDPKRGAPEAWAGHWTLVSAVVAELGPGWYFVVRGGEVSYEVVVEGR